MRRRHFSGSDFSMTFLRPCAPWSSYRNNRGFSLPNRQSTIRSGTARLVGDVSGNTWPLSRTALVTRSSMLPTASTTSETAKGAWFQEASGNRPLQKLHAQRMVGRTAKNLNCHVPVMV